MMHGYWDGAFGYGMFFGPLVMILFVVAVVLAAVWMLRLLTGTSAAQSIWRSAPE